MMTKGRLYLTVVTIVVGQTHTLSDVLRFEVYLVHKLTLCGKQENSGPNVFAMDYDEKTQVSVDLCG